MQEERKKILEMLAEGKIGVEEAERLMNAIDENPEDKGKSAATAKKPKYLRVLVEPKEENSNGDRVNIRVPINLIRAGLKFAAFIPKSSQAKVGDALKDKGLDVDLNEISAKDLEDLIVHLNDLEIDVDGEEVVKVFCE